MKMMFAMSVLTAMLCCLAAPATGRRADGAAAPVRRKTVRKGSGRQSQAAATQRPDWWEIENIDGRNEEHPTYMLPLILPDRPHRQN